MSEPGGLREEHVEEVRQIVRSETASVAAQSAEIGDPAPLGLAAFALTTFVLSALNASLFPESERILTTFVPLALFYGGIAQLIAGIWEFRNNNTFGAVAFTSYSMFWVALGFLILFESQLGLTEATLPLALGLTLLAWTIFTFYMLIATFVINVALIIVFALLLATLAILTIGELLAPGLVIIGGYVGIVTALAAWYTSAAGVINDTFGRVVLPVGPRG